MNFSNDKKLIEKYSLLKNLRDDLLTMCSENVSILNTLGLQAKDLHAHGFTYSDMALFLTDAANDSTKYYITAFWKKSEIEEGLDYLKRWRAFVNENKEKVKKKDEPQ